MKLQTVYIPGTSDRISVKKDEDKLGFSVHIPHRSDRYLDELVKLTCSVDLLKLRLFPNAKEVTESFACFNAIRKMGKIKSLGNSDIVCLVIGDGHTPRTAATIAFRSRWTCYSVDPLLNLKDRYNRVDRLKLFKCKHSEFDYSLLKGKEVIVVHPHSHAPFDEVVSMVDMETSRQSSIVIPCCEKILAHRAPDMMYDDDAIHSAKRKVLIWI